MKNFKKIFNILIFPICLIIGLIRQQQIQTFQSSIGKPTMTGVFALYSYIFVGICLISISLLFTDIYRSNLHYILKIVLKIIVLIIGLSLVCFLLLLSH